MVKSSHENDPRESQCSASSHEQFDLDESPEDLEKSTEWIWIAGTGRADREGTDGTGLGRAAPSGH